jgi:hypothetical protein
MTNLGGDDEKRGRASLETQANFKYGQTRFDLRRRGRVGIQSRVSCNKFSHFRQNKGTNINPLSGTWQM